MIKNSFDIPQLFLRLALGLGFIFPVMDRLGLWGAPGSSGVAWGNWSNFVDYTHSLMPYLSATVAGVLALLATIAELTFGIALIIGYKTRWAARGSFLLTLLFAVSMFFFAGRLAPFTYSVFADSAAALLLSCVTQYRWSLDLFLARSKKYIDRHDAQMTARQEQDLV